jgi:hypothetical protein
VEDLTRLKSKYLPNFSARMDFRHVGTDVIHRNNFSVGKQRSDAAVSHACGLPAVMRRFTLRMLLTKKDGASQPDRNWRFTTSAIRQLQALQFPANANPPANESGASNGGTAPSIFRAHAAE